MNENHGSSLLIIILSVLLVVLFMIPITGYFITPSDTPDPLETPIYELGNRSLNTVFVDNGLTLQASQLVTNGDFSDGTTGWNNNGSPTFSITNGVSNIVSDGSIARNIHQRLSNIENEKVFSYYKVKSNSGQCNFTYASTNDLASNNIGAFAITNTSWHINSSLDTLSYANAYFGFGRGIAQPFNTDIDYLYIFYVSTLITNKQYSPLYNTTFDLMSDAQIKAQMDDWVADGIDTLNIWLTYNALGLDQTLSEAQMNYYYDLYVYYSSL